MPRLVNSKTGMIILRRNHGRLKKTKDSPLEIWRFLADSKQWRQIRPKLLLLAELIFDLHPIFCASHSFLISLIFLCPFFMFYSFTATTLAFFSRLLSPEIGLMVRCEIACAPEKNVGIYFTKHRTYTSGVFSTCHTLKWWWLVH